MFCPYFQQTGSSLLAPSFSILCNECRVSISCLLTRFTGLGTGLRDRAEVSSFFTSVTFSCMFQRKRSDFHGYFRHGVSKASKQRVKRYENIKFREPCKIRMDSKCFHEPTLPTEMNNTDVLV